MQRVYQEITHPWTVPTVEGTPGVEIDFSKKVLSILPKRGSSVGEAENQAIALA